MKESVNSNSPLVDVEQLDALVAPYLRLLQRAADFFIEDSALEGDRLKRQDAIRLSIEILGPAIHTGVVREIVAHYSRAGIIPKN